MDLYKYAAQNNLLFPSDRGQLTVTQLFQMPLLADHGSSLDTIAQAVNEELKTYDQESFVEEVSKERTAAKLRCQNALEIVKDVIATRKAEKDAAKALRDKKAKKAMLRDLIDKKENEVLSSSTKEELERQYAELVD